MNTEHQLKSKIKISMIFVSKEYEIQTKMVQEQWLHLKKTFIFFYWVEMTFGETESKFGREGVNNRFLYTMKNSMHITYIMCQSGRLTSARFEHLVCHRYLWYIMCVQDFKCNKFITSWTCLMMPNNGRSISQKSISN